MKKIMIVEDNIALGKAIKTIFEKRGNEVKWAKESSEFFSILEKNDDIIFLDINLPGEMSGFAILQKIKEFGSDYRHIPVVMLTNLSDIQDMDKATNMGATDYIIKSNIKLNELIEYTEKVVHNNSSNN